MIVYFLEARIPLTKTYIRKADGTIEKSSYPHVYNVTSHEENCKDMQAFFKQIVAYAAKNFCLVKGTLSRPLKNESRAGTTNTNDETDWICLDIDGLSGKVDIPQLLKALNLDHITYVMQYSASYKVENNDLRVHIYMQLDKPYTAPFLKQWLTHLNLNTPLLASQIRLTRTGNSIHWPLDISTCQNDKLLYIAPPVFQGMKDPLPPNRIKYVKRPKAVLDLSTFQPNATILKEQATTLFNTLREKAGLPKRKVTYKYSDATEYMVNPDQATITGTKTERDFVYFNLNGGDSWAYYHPENNPEFIYNFKNEPVYRTKDLLPDYWKEVLTVQARAKKASQIVAKTGAQVTQTKILLAFCDPKSSLYYRGYYDPATDHLELNPARSEKQLRDFAKQHDMPLGDFIPEWTYTFDPASTVRIDPTAKYINTYRPSPFNTISKPQTTCPPTILKIIHHALGSNADITQHFMNWLAVILQHKTRTLTAWVLHGTTGTGKGVLMNKILRPLFGTSQTAIRRMEELNEQYNHYIQHAFIVFVDEVQTRALVNEKGAIAKLKNFITEPTITIRRMYSNAFEVPNYSNWIFASNMPDPVAIDSNDRRFNVAAYQAKSISLTETDITRIDKELQAFHNYLSSYPADVALAATYLNTEDRTNLIAISETAPDTVANALRKGDMSFFIDLLPTDTRPPQFSQAERLADYKHVLHQLIDRTQKSGACAIARDELRYLFEYTVGGMPDSPNKFTSYLKHRRLHMTKVWVDNKTVNGLRVIWTDTKNFKTYKGML